jgi:M6 family metalloprotease-like protein
MAYVTRPILALLVLVLGAASVRAQTAADFGYRSIPAEGVRPLLTILVSFAEPDAQFIMPYGWRRYEEDFFGSPYRSFPNAFGAGGFFHTNSNYRFRFENAGIVGPYPSQDDPATTGDERRWRCLIGKTEPGCNDAVLRTNALVQAARDVDFSRFDRNRDGIVTNDELAVLIIEATPAGEDQGGGQRRGLVGGAVNLGAVAARLDVASVRSAGDIEVRIHEVTHLLGIGDHYGASTNVNRNLAMMSSLEKQSDGYHTANLDPYSRIRLGWLEPAVVSIRDPRRMTLTASNLAGDLQNRAVILHDPTQPDKYEFFVLEYRTRRNRLALPPGSREIHGLASGTSRMLSARPSLDGVPGVVFHDRGRDFTYRRSEGYILPSAIAGQTLPLHEVVRSSTGDAYLSTDPQEATRGGTPLVTVGHLFRPDRPAPPGTVPLRRWRRVGGEEVFVTSDPRWGDLNSTIEGYRFERTIGYVFWAPDVNYDADPFARGDSTVDDDGLAIWHVKIDPITKAPLLISEPLPIGQLPLSRWWNPTRNDSFTTTRWLASSTTPERGYRYVREEGRVWESPGDSLGTDGIARKRLPLRHWWNETTKDNLTTTAPAWASSNPGEVRNGYRFVGTIGWVDPQPTTAATVPVFLDRTGGRSTLTTNQPNTGDLEGFLMPARVDAALYIVPVRGLEGRPFASSPRQVFWKAGQSAGLYWFDGTPAGRILVDNFSVEQPTLGIRLMPPPP